MSDSRVNEEKILSLLHSITGLAEEVGCIPERTASLRLVEKVRRNEWYLTLLGETSSGKSTFANSLMLEDLLPVGAPATTGVVTLIQSDPATSQDQYFFINPDGTIGNELSRSEFHSEAKGIGRENRLLVRKPFIGILPPGLTLVDTPGFNSCIEEHREVLNDYIPESDAIVFFLNYRLGLRKPDLEYFKLVFQILNESTSDESSEHRLVAVINWAPSINEDKRVLEIRNGLEKHVGYQGPIYILKVQHAGERIHLQNDHLLRHIMGLTDNLERKLQLLRNVVVMAEDLLARIGESIELKRHVFQVEETNLDLICERLHELESLKDEMLAIVSAADNHLKSKISTLCQQEYLSIKGIIDNELSEASRWTSIESASTYISETVLKCGIQNMSLKLPDLIHEDVKRLNEDLDGLAADTEEKIRSLLDIPIGRPYGGIDEKLLSNLVKKLGLRGTTEYLSKLAGAPGARGVVGVMNLSRKLMGKANRLWGKPVFGREAIARVGPILRQFGLTTSRAASLAATIAFEAARILYKVATWKGKLREKLEPVLAEQANILKKQALEVVGDIMASTKQMVDDNYTRRIEVLSEALSAREEGRTINPHQLESWISRWTKHVNECERFREDL